MVRLLRWGFHKDSVRAAGLVRLRIAALALILAFVPILCACTKGADWQLKDVTDVVHSLQFRLSDEQGNTVTADAYHGDIVMLYFGYTHCPDVCPLTLSKLGRAVDALDDDSARRVKILFVSVDPKRDSATQLATYTNAFGPEFVGLRGSPSRIRTITKRYRVTYSYGKPDAEGDYAVNHSSSVFIFDGSGEARLLAMSSDGVSAITHDLALLARSHS